MSKNTRIHSHIHRTHTLAHLQYDRKSMNRYPSNEYFTLSRAHTHQSQVGIQKAANELDGNIANNKQTNNRMDPIPKTLHKQESITGLFIG